MANPTLGLAFLQELPVIAVSSLADNMLYRAVALTCVGHWLRDRLFEAGLDDIASLALPGDFKWPAAVICLLRRRCTASMAAPVGMGLLHHFVWVRPTCELRLSQAAPCFSCDSFEAECMLRGGVKC